MMRFIRSYTVFTMLLGVAILLQITPVLNMFNVQRFKRHLPKVANMSLVRIRVIVYEIKGVVDP